MKIIKINGVTLYFLFVLLFCGYIKIGLIILFIVICHELGHILIAKFFKYKVLEVIIYPFGGMTKVEKDINTPVKKELFIASAGVFFQIVLGLLVNIFFSDVSDFNKYNLSIMLFNMLPIIPLDGSTALNSILNKFFSYKISYYLYIIVSFAVTVWYIIINVWFSLNNYLIITLFIFKTYKAIKDYKYIYNRFLLERYLHDYDYKYFSTKKGNLDILKIDTYQYFKNNGKIVSEKEKLKELFDNK